ncbi:hypothetical protein [Rhodanobacter sp. OR87]|uniref:hypothetical protein n=1 Tax=Rhodanobacter sp. OR87 TaxID=1076523 RepID=UPI0003F580DD|nr:hypothetical protein [Rhodanobacter sp. OR87]
MPAKDTSGTSPREAFGAVDALFAARAGHDVGASRRLILPGARFVMVRPDGRVRIEPDRGYLEALGKRKEAFRERIRAAQVTVQGNLARVWRLRFPLRRQAVPLRHRRLQPGARQPRLAHRRGQLDRAEAGLRARPAGQGEVAGRLRGSFATRRCTL